MHLGFTMEKEMVDELNGQINAELFSEYIYLAMAAYLENENLPGFAHWMKKQAEEEREHAMKFFDYVVERGERVELKAINEPPKEWSGALDVFEKAFAHEKMITSRINKLMDIAKEKKDHATESMLKWFVDEQVEEEASASEVVEKLKMIGDSKGSLLMLDKGMGKRE